MKVIITHEIFSGAPIKFVSKVFVNILSNLGKNLESWAIYLKIINITKSYGLLEISRTSKKKMALI